MTATEIRDLIKSTGLSQAKFAAAIGAGVRSVEGWAAKGLNDPIKAEGLRAIVGSPTWPCDRCKYARVAWDYEPCVTCNGGKSWQPKAEGGE